MLAAARLKTTEEERPGASDIWVNSRDQRLWLVSGSA